MESAVQTEPDDQAIKIYRRDVTVHKSYKSWLPFKELCINACQCEVAVTLFERLNCEIMAKAEQLAELNVKIKTLDRETAEKAKAYTMLLDGATAASLNCNDKHNVSHGHVMCCNRCRIDGNK